MLTQQMFAVSDPNQERLRISFQALQNLEFAFRHDPMALKFL
jgi:hypothetical protein